MSLNEDAVMEIFLRADYVTQHMLLCTFRFVRKTVSNCIPHMCISWKHKHVLYDIIFTYTTNQLSFSTKILYLERVQNGTYVVHGTRTVKAQELTITPRNIYMESNLDNYMKYLVGQ